MDISPGIYIIQNHVDKSYVLDHPPQDQKPRGTRAEWPRDCRKLTLQWCLRPSPVGSSSTYQVQNLGTGQWLTASATNGPCMGSMNLAVHWDLGSVKSGVGHMKVYSINVAFSLSNSKDKTLFVNLSDTPNQSHLWSFEKISDDVKEQPVLSKISQPQDSPPDAAVRPNKIIRKDSNSPYVDDTHFHTDVLFNMPRTPLTRIQRAAALEWVRKLGAANVPTMESFDECERKLEARQNDHGQPPTPEGTKPYGDDAHFHTYMLFNMPRATFTRTQRATALEWARRLGATNVPTIDSFDECERILDSEQSGGSNAG